MNFTDKLDALMKSRGINRATLARETGIPSTTIQSLYDKGYHNVKLSTLKALVNYFQCDYSYLVEDDEITPKSKDINDEEIVKRLYSGLSAEARKDLLHWIVDSIT